MADDAKLSRAQGCLLGQLAGDSLGGLVEFCTPEAILKEYPDGVRELADGGHGAPSPASLRTIQRWLLPWREHW